MKKLLILTIVFAGLAAFVYFYEIAGEEKREEQKQLEESLFRLGRSDIESIEIERSGKDRIILSRENESWILRAPIEALADAASVDSLAGSIKSARRTRTLEDPDLSAYGLSEPQTRLKLRTEGRELLLLFGDKDFTESQVYTKLAEGPEVFLTPASLLTALDKEVGDWRNKAVLSFRRNEVEAIEIIRARDQIDLQKRNDQWFLTAPLEEPADENTVSSLLSTLEFAKVEEFVEERPEDLQPYGLVPPVASVRLREQGSETWAQLEIGKAEGDGYYARDTGRSPVFRIGGDLIDDLNQDLWDFRGKNILDVKQDQVARLTVIRGEERLVVRREEFKWIIEEPAGQAGKEVPSYRIWYPLDDLRFTTILEEDRAFPAPAVEVRVELSDGSARSFLFSGEGETFLARNVAGVRQGAISKEDFEKLIGLEFATLSD